MDKGTQQHKPVPETHSHYSQMVAAQHLNAELLAALTDCLYAINTGQPRNLEAGSWYHRALAVQAKAVRS